MRALLTILLSLAVSPAFAGQRYCSQIEEIPYEIVEIPHGYAIVRMAYSDFCSQNHMSDDPTYTCYGDDPDYPGYKMGFTPKNGGLLVTFAEGGQQLFKACE